MTTSCHLQIAFFASTCLTVRDISCLFDFVVADLRRIAEMKRMKLPDDPETLVELKRQAAALVDSRANKKNKI